MPFFGTFFNDMTVADEAQRPVPWRGSTAVIEQITFILIKVYTNDTGSLFETENETENEC